MDNFIRAEFEDSRNILNASLGDATLLMELQGICEVCIKSLRNGHKILFAGNGGSAADAQHLSAELVSRFYYDRPGLPSVALTTDTSILTAVGNDYGYDQIFARQVQALGVAGDVFIGLTTSGGSPNILRAFETCREKAVITVCFTGAKGVKVPELCDHALKVPSNSTPRIQEIHGLAGHVLCAVIEKAMFPK